MTGIEATARTHERAGPRASDERKRHPREMEDWLNFHIYHPLANRLAGLLVPTPVTPNMVSFAGWLLIVAATFLYTGLAWPVSVLLAFPVHALWQSNIDYAQPQIYLAIIVLLLLVRLPPVMTMLLRLTKRRVARDRAPAVS